MSLLLARTDAHPFMGMDAPWLLAQRARMRRDHPFIVWAPFDGPTRSIGCGEFDHRVGRMSSSPHLPNRPSSIGRPAPEYGIAIVEDFARATLENIAKAGLRRMLEDEDQEAST